MKCSCVGDRRIEEIGFWERCPLENGGHTMFSLNRCLSCGGITGFPDTNLQIALERGTKQTKRELNSIIGDATQQLKGKL